MTPSQNDLGDERRRVSIRNIDQAVVATEGKHLGAGYAASQPGHVPNRAVTACGIENDVGFG